MRANSQPGSAAEKLPGFLCLPLHAQLATVYQDWEQLLDREEIDEGLVFSPTAEPAGLTNADLSRPAEEILEAGLRAALNGVEVALPLEDHLFR